MWKLLRKDWLLNRKALGLSYLFWSAIWLGLPLQDLDEAVSLGSWAVMVAGACAFLPIMAIAREDRFKASALACSLPVTRRQIVTARYVGGGVAAVTGAAIALGAVLGLSAVSGWPPHPALGTVPLTMACVIGVMMAVTMPFVLRFGITGLLGMMVGIQVLGIVVLLAATAIRGLTRHYITPLVQAVVESVALLRLAVGPIGLAALVLTAVLALNVLSWQLAVAVYDRREF